MALLTPRQERRIAGLQTEKEHLYKELLKKYIRHIVNETGKTFLEPRKAGHYRYFTEEERQELVNVWMGEGYPKKQGS